MDKAHTYRTLPVHAIRAAAIGFLMTGANSPMHAQELPSFQEALQTPLSQPFVTARQDLDTTPYSTSLLSPTTADQGLDRPSALLARYQPPPRRRYGRPTYSDKTTNPDGSNKYTFAGGAGFTLPIGGTHSYLSPGWKFQVGGGRNFNRTYGLLAQFDFDRFGIQQSTLNNLLTTYNNEIAAYNAANPNNPVAPLTQLNGASHDWSFTLNPIMNYHNGDRAGAYAVAGAGFYHKTANFSYPAVELVNTGFGIAQVAANQSVDKYTSNALGLNAGFGFTYKPSLMSYTRLFAEARYVWTDNQPRPYSETGIPGNPNYYNVFPQNSARTTYIPITFGLRF